MEVRLKKRCMGKGSELKKTTGKNENWDGEEALSKQKTVG